MSLLPVWSSSSYPLSMMLLLLLLSSSPLVLRGCVCCAHCCRAWHCLWVGAVVVVVIDALVAIVIAISISIAVALALALVVVVVDDDDDGVVAEHVLDRSFLDVLVYVCFARNKW